jgi:ribonuclease HI
VVNWIEKGWAKSWQKNNWLKADKKKAENSDLWEKLLVLLKKHKVKFNWVKWHAWHEENERCDELATKEILKNTWKIEEEKNLTKQDLIQKVLNTGIDSEQKKIKITSVGQACKKCWTPVEKAIPKKKNTKNKSYYYEYYLTCPNCKTNYFVDEAIVMIKRLDV